MIKLFYAMQEELLKRYALSKNDLLAARNGMSAEGIKEGKAEILRECQIHDFDAEEPETLYSVDNGVAKIHIAGMLVNNVDFCSAFFGETVTTYRYIREAIAQAEADPQVEKIMYLVNSGGGYVSGCEMTFQSILNSEKPSVAVVGDMAASAAYWLASGADEIISISKTGFFGSIGVAAEIVNRDKQDEGVGIKRIVLTNTSSKDKRPDEMTEDGQQVLVDELNAIYDVFVDSILIKRGSKLSRKDIDDLGGKVLIASEAVKMGLVDRIMDAAEVEGFLSSTDDFAANKNVSFPVTGENNLMEESMNLKEFLEKNPEAKAEFDGKIKAAEGKGFDAGKESAVDDAIKADRERGAGILALSGASLPKEVLEAYESGIDEGKFAMTEVTRRNEKIEALKPEDTDLGGAKATGQIPGKGKDRPKGTPKTATNEQVAEIDAWDKLYDKGDK